jgi:hypothetical protein
MNLFHPSPPIHHPLNVSDFVKRMLREQWAFGDKQPPLNGAIDRRKGVWAVARTLLAGLRLNHHPKKLLVILHSLAATAFNVLLGEGEGIFQLKQPVWRPRFSWLF